MMIMKSHSLQWLQKQRTVTSTLECSSNTNTLSWMILAHVKKASEKGVYSSSNSVRWQTQRSMTICINFFHCPPIWWFYLFSCKHMKCEWMCSAVYHHGVGKWVPASAGKEKAGMVHSVSGWTRGVQVKLWDPLRTRAIHERLRGVFTMRRYTNPPYLTLPRLNMHGVLMRYSHAHSLHVGLSSLCYICQCKGSGTGESCRWHYFC